MTKAENKEKLAQLLRVLSGKANEFQKAVDEIVKSELDASAADPKYCHNDVRKVIFSRGDYSVIATVNVEGPVYVTFELFCGEKIIVSANKVVFDFGLDENYRVFKTLPDTPYWKLIGNIAALVNDIPAVEGDQEIFKDLIAKREYVNKETVNLINRRLAERKLSGKKGIEITKGVNLNINVTLSLNFDINEININYGLSHLGNKTIVGSDLYLFFKLDYDYSEQEVLECADGVFSELLGRFVTNEMKAVAYK